MRHFLTAAAATLCLTGAALAGSDKTPPGQNENGNWGQLTSGAIADGFPQGPHASDPSGDGHGPGTADEPRNGLPNLGETKGDLSNTIDLISGN